MGTEREARAKAVVRLNNWGVANLYSVLGQLGADAAG